MAVTQMETWRSFNRAEKAPVSSRLSIRRNYGGIIGTILCNMSDSDRGNPRK